MSVNVIKIDDIEYVRKDAVNNPGKRAVVVVDRGWIFAGDVHEENGRIKLTRALWLFRWESIGFAETVKNPKSNKVDLRPVDDVDIPADAEVFRIPVADNWGL
jgi:hypothetical protein